MQESDLTILLAGGCLLLGTELGVRLPDQESIDKMQRSIIIGTVIGFVYSMLTHGVF